MSPKPHSPEGSELTVVGVSVLGSWFPHLQSGGGDVASCEHVSKVRALRKWCCFLYAGKSLNRDDLRAPPLPGGLLLTRQNPLRRAPSGKPFLVGAACLPPGLPLLAVSLQRVPPSTCAVTVTRDSSEGQQVSGSCFAYPLMACFLHVGEGPGPAAGDQISTGIGGWDINGKY